MNAPNYYYLDPASNQQSGPYALRDLQQLVKCGAAGTQMLFFREGDSGWKSLTEYPELGVPSPAASVPRRRTTRRDPDDREMNAQDWGVAALVGFCAGALSLLIFGMPGIAGFIITFGSVLGGAYLGRQKGRWIFGLVCTALFSVLGLLAMYLLPARQDEPSGTKKWAIAGGMILVIALAVGWSIYELMSVG